MSNKRMLIDASHPEETRVVVLTGNRLEEFDYETNAKKQLKGNIYLAKVTRVEPSLQAAFVDYGGNRHGFLPFSEIHPDYYRIPIADREKLLAEAAARASEDDDDDGNGREAQEKPRRRRRSRNARAADAEAKPVDEGEEDQGVQAEEAQEPLDEADATDTDIEAGATEAAEAQDHEPQDHEAQDYETQDHEAQDQEAQDREPQDQQAGEDEPAAAVAASDVDAADQDQHETAPEATAPEAPEEPAAEAAAEVEAAPESDDAEEPEAPLEAGDDDEPTEPGPRNMPLAATQEIITEAAEAPEADATDADTTGADTTDGEATDGDAADDAPAETGKRGARARRGRRGPKAEPVEIESEASVETVGGDEVEEDARKRRSIQQRYKIQEVIKRRQVILVQVAKEERGTKGAALTTYLSLAGRYCVLMPNTARGGGISRKISNATDRRRLKKVTSELEIPEGMAVIVRTAGSERSKAEIRRDYEYLIRLWDQIRATTLESTAPALIHEEANLIKRAIRDLYDRDMDRIEVQGDESYKDAKAFMKSLMPSHARKVQLYKDVSVPLFFRNQVEEQLDAMHQTTVRLRSGGYIVMNSTEALVAIDVNSGKATKERHIEETALKTNLEAADEVARQLRLRDLAGLIVIDFIDMEENRHNRDVERRLKEAMRLDRARIQLGRISAFGLLELSRQRLRPSLFESSTEPCLLCGGSGHVRSIESSALHLLRALEEEGIRRRGGQLQVKAPAAVALYVLNQKRARLLDIEQRYDFEILIEQDEGLIAPAFALDHFGAEPVRDAEVEDEEERSTGEAGEQDQGRRKRRRRRPRRKDGASDAPRNDEARAAEEDDAEDENEAAAEPVEARGEDDGETDPRKARRRRGKRGGRRRTRSKRDDAATDGEESETPDEDLGSEEPRAADSDGEAAAAGANEDQEKPEADADSEEATGRKSTRRPRQRGGRRRRGSADKAAAPEASEVTEAPAAETETETIAPAAASETAAVTAVETPDEPDEPEADQGTAEVSIPAFSEPEVPIAADSDREDDVAEPEAEEASEEKPKRRGWWNRFV